MGVSTAKDIHSNRNITIAPLLDGNSPLDHPKHITLWWKREGNLPMRQDAWEDSIWLSWRQVSLAQDLEIHRVCGVRSVSSTQPQSQNLGECGSEQLDIWPSKTSLEQKTSVCHETMVPFFKNVLFIWGLQWLPKLWSVDSSASAQQVSCLIFIVFINDSLRLWHLSESKALRLALPFETSQIWMHWGNANLEFQGSPFKSKNSGHTLPSSNQTSAGNNPFTLYNQFDDFSF